MSTLSLYSLGLGLLIGSVYTGTSLIVNRRALRHPDRFMVIALGGMVARMMVCLIVLLVVLLLMELDELAFVGAFFFSFTLGLIYEVVWLLRRARRSDS